MAVRSPARPAPARLPNLAPRPSPGPRPRLRRSSLPRLRILVPLRNHRPRPRQPSSQVPPIAGFLPLVTSPSSSRTGTNRPPKGPSTATKAPILPASVSLWERLVRPEANARAACVREWAADPTRANARPPSAPAHATGSCSAAVTARSSGPAAVVPCGSFATQERVIPNGDASGSPDVREAPEAEPPNRWHPPLPGPSRARSPDALPPDRTRCSAAALRFRRGGTADA